MGTGGVGDGDGEGEEEADEDEDEEEGDKAADDDIESEDGRVTGIDCRLMIDTSVIEHNPQWIKSINTSLFPLL